MECYQSFVDKFKKKKYYDIFKYDIIHSFILDSLQKLTVIFLANSPVVALSGYRLSTDFLNYTLVCEFVFIQLHNCFCLLIFFLLFLRKVILDEILDEENNISLREPVWLCGILTLCLVVWDPNPKSGCVGS